MVSIRYPMGNSLSTLDGAASASPDANPGPRASRARHSDHALSRLVGGMSNRCRGTARRLLRGCEQRLASKAAGKNCTWSRSCFRANGNATGLKEKGNGTVVDAGLTGMLPLLRRLVVSATGTVTWANARYTRSYFGVDAEQSATALSFGSAVPTFAPGAGLRTAPLALSASLRLDHHWSVQSIARAEVLLGDAGRSPLTEQRIQLTFGGFLAYRL